jgi:phosphate transport system permease protein
MHQGISASRRAYNIILCALMYLAAGLTCLLVLFLIGYVLYKGVPNLSWELVSTSPSYLSGTIGILPDLLNTLYVVMATILVVLPLGVCAAIYLTEYAANKRLVGIIEYAAETLSGIPSIIYGLPVPRHEDLPVGRQHDACHHESADHHAHHAGEP